MTNYFKAEFNGSTTLRSSKNAEYKFATVYSGGHVTFHTRRDLAGKDGGSVVEVTAIDATEFRAITKIQKKAQAIASAERKAAFLAANPILNRLYELPEDFFIVDTGCKTTVRYFTRTLDSGVTFSESLLATLTEAIEKVSA